MKCCVACCGDMSSMSVSQSEVLKQSEGYEASPGASISGCGESMASDSAAALFTAAAGGTRDGL